MDKNELIDKIKKLLALATSCNEHEAKLAAQKASELLTTYNLTMKDVEYAPGEKKFDFKFHHTERRRATPEQKYVFGIIQTFFFVAVIQGRESRLGTKVFSFVGRPHNIQIADYVYDFLVDAFKNLWKSYRKQTNCPLSSRQSYMGGLYGGLYKQLEAVRNSVQTTTGLVVSEDSELLKFMREQFDNLQEGKGSRIEVSDTEALRKGLEDGEKIRIAMGLDDNSKPNKQVGQTLVLGYTERKSA